MLPPTATPNGSQDQSNPLLGEWTPPDETPPFPAIRPEHFRPAFDRAMADHMAEIEAIATGSATPSFANTLVALERSGRALDRVSAVFHALAGAHTNDALMAIEREMSPLLAAHRNRIHLHDGLYARIKAVWDARDTLGLTPEQARVLERYDVTFRRAGAGLPADTKSRIAAAAMAAARPTTRPSSPRRSRCGPNGRGYSAIRLLRIIASMTPWRRRPKPSGCCSSACGRRRGPAPWRIAMPSRT